VLFEVKNDSAPLIAFKQRHTPDDKLTVVNQFATLNQQNAQYSSLDVYNYITLKIPACFNPQRLMIKQTNQRNTV